MRAAVVDFCAGIAGDPLLVQGAGGNVSWKEDGTLWIKASGTRLADIVHRDIFVGVDLHHLQAALARRDFAVAPRLQGAGSLRPSIETPLHVLMPHRVVAHLHAVEVLAQMVRSDADSILAARLPEGISWSSVGYVKPGAPLAAALADALRRRPDADVVFLHNHGLILGGDDSDSLRRRLLQVTEALRSPPRPLRAPRPAPAPLRTAGERLLQPVADEGVRQLALDPVLFERLPQAWALFPDHVVFLGAHADCCAGAEELEARLAADDAGVGPLFVRDLGVFVPPEFNATRHAQLRCYYDVLARQTDPETLRTLTDSEVAELLDWEAEKYRQRQAG